MSASDVNAIAKQIRTERRTKKKPWKQYELKKAFGDIPLRQPIDEVRVFRADASLGKLWIRNNHIGYAYEARVWVGHTIEVDGDELETPARMLLELELSKLKKADLRVDISKVRGTFTVGAGPKGKIIFVSKGRQSSE